MWWGYAVKACGKRKTLLKRIYANQACYQFGQSGDLVHLLNHSPSLISKSAMHRLQKSKKKPNCLLHSRLKRLKCGSDCTTCRHKAIALMPSFDIVDQAALPLAYAPDKVKCVIGENCWRSSCKDLNTYHSPSPALMTHLPRAQRDSAHSYARCELTQTSQPFLYCVSGDERHSIKPAIRC